jgi:hypothetical protein
MKKLFFSVILVISFFYLTQPINAQVKIGIQAGLNLTDINTKNYSLRDFNTAIRTRFVAGGLISYNFLSLLEVQFEPAYVQKGAKANFSEEYQGIPVDVEGSVTANFIDIPILLKANLINGPIKPYLLLGGSIDFLIGDANLTIDNASVNGQDVTPLIPNELKDQKLDIKNKDYILCLGAGIEIPVGLLSVLIEGRYDIGLTNLNNVPDDNTEFKTTGLQLKAGILFGL